jgi:hypothetical protein
MMALQPENDDRETVAAFLIAALLAIAVVIAECKRETDASAIRFSNSKSLSLFEE